MVVGVGDAELRDVVPFALGGAFGVERFEFLLAGGRLRIHRKMMLAVVGCG